MRKLVVVAALALISTSAHAEVHEFRFAGHVVRIEVPRHCGNPSCVRVFSREIGKGGKDTESPAGAAANVTGTGNVVQPREHLQPTSLQGDRTQRIVQGAAPGATQGTTQSDAAPKVEARVDPLAAYDDRKPAARLSLPATDARLSATTGDKLTATNDMPPVTNDRPSASDDKRPAIATRTLDASEQKTEPAKPEGPAGLWLTEKHESKIRIQECGKALCGFVEDKPNEKVFADMQPGQKNHWDGKIIDTRNGSTYEGHVTLKNAEALRVEGCTFAGLFCGGETWTRIH
jgi:uncharacterized protein (DUF2147 family)